MAKLLIILFFGLISLSNQSFCQAGSLLKPDSTLKIFIENNKKGIKNNSGEVILNPVYDQLGWSDQIERPEISSLGYQKNNLWGLFNAELKTVATTKYSTLLPLNNEMFIASIMGKYSRTDFYGLIDDQGNTIIDFSYRNLIPAGQYLIAATKQKNTIQFGLISSDGKEILPFEYFQIRFLGASKFEITTNNNVKSLIFLERKPKTILQNFDSISDFKNGVAVIYKNGTQGLISEEGKILLSIKYKKIEWNNGEKINVTPVDHWEIFNQEAKLLLAASADTVFFLNDSLLVRNTSYFSALYHWELEKDLSLLKGRFMGVFADQFILENNTKSVLVSSDSTKENRYFEGEIAWNKDYLFEQKQSFSGKYNVLYNAAGKAILADSFKLMQESIAVKADGFWGLYDVDFNEIIPSLYDEIIPTSAQQIIVKFRGEYGVIDQENKWIFPPKYREIEEISYGTYKGVNKYLREFIINENYQTEAKLYYDVYDNYIVESDIEGKSRLVNRMGEPLSLFLKGKYAGQIEAGILFREIDQLRFLDSKGKRLFQIEKYDSVFLCDDEFFPIVKNGQQGFIDHQGLLRVANRYDSVRPYQDDMSAVKIRSSWGFIDRREVLQIQPYFKAVSDFKNGVALVNYNDKYGLINKEGKYMLEANYEKIEKVGAFYILHKNHKFGAATSTANIIAHPNYDAIEVMGSYLKVKQYNKFRILDSNGKQLLANEYDTIVYDHGRNLFFCKKHAKTQQVFLTDLLQGKQP
jgi:hypothetical protein